MSHFLIDCDGQRLTLSAAAAAQQLGRSAYQHCFADFVVRNLGYVRVRISPGHVIVEAAPGRLSMRTYSSLATYLDEANPDRVSLSWFDHDWQHEIFPRVSALCRRLLLLMHRREYRLNSNYVSQQRPVAELPRESALHAVYEHWKRGAGHLDINDCPELFEQQLQSKFSSGWYDHASGRLRLSELGQGFRCWSPKTQAQLINTPVIVSGTGARMPRAWCGRM